MGITWLPGLAWSFAFMALCSSLFNIHYLGGQLVVPSLSMTSVTTTPFDNNVSSRQTLLIYDNGNKNDNNENNIILSITTNYPKQRSIYLTIQDGGQIMMLMAYHVSFNLYRMMIGVSQKSFQHMIGHWHNMTIKLVD